MKLEDFLIQEEGDGLRHLPDGRYTSREPTQDRLRELFDYIPETGDLVWRIRRGRSVAGKTAGTINPSDGYLQIGVDGKIYRAHRLVWIWHYRTVPEMLDRRDTVKTNNRVWNLRPANQAQNEANKAINASDTSGYKGVFFDNQKRMWHSAIKVDGKTKHIGFFSDPKAASESYFRAAKTYFGEFARAS
jgi:hypothetical protein